MKKLFLPLILVFSSLLININCMEREESQSSQILGLPKELWAEIAAALSQSKDLREAVKNIQKLSVANKAFHKLLEEPVVKKYIINRVAQHFGEDIKSVEALFGLPESKEHLDRLLAKFKKGKPKSFRLLRNLIENENTVALNYFFKHGINPNEISKRIDSNILISTSSFLKDDYDKKWRMLKFLIDKGADINGIDNLLGISILINEFFEILRLGKAGKPVIAEHAIENIKYLLDHGADVNLSSEKLGLSPLRLALNLVARNPKYIAIVELLLERGAIVTDDDLQSIKNNKLLLDLLSKYKK